LLEKKGDGGHGEGRHGSGDHISGGDGFSGHGGHDGVGPDESASAIQKSTGSNFTASTFFFFRILVWMALRTVAAALIKSQFVSIGLPHDRCILACWHSSFEWSVGDGQWIR
jgi:hypothetical protein